MPVCMTGPSVGARTRRDWGWSNRGAASTKSRSRPNEQPDYPTLAFLCAAAVCFALWVQPDSLEVAEVVRLRRSRGTPKSHDFGYQIPGKLGYTLHRLQREAAL